MTCGRPAEFLRTWRVGGEGQPGSASAKGICSLIGNKCCLGWLRAGPCLGLLSREASLQAEHFTSFCFLEKRRSAHRTAEEKTPDHVPDPSGEWPPCGVGADPGRTAGFDAWQHEAGLVELLLQQLGTRGCPREPPESQ